jgi:SAM-dependent methyltransferase
MIPHQPAQALSVKRAEVEFHNFAALGEPERVTAMFRGLNAGRAATLRRNAGFIGSMSPFLEIGANAGHTSYMLVNEFNCEGFALDLSADALRHGRALQQMWDFSRSPVRITGDAANLPFQDGSLRMVLACQMLSQFMNIEKVFVEAKRVLAPGGVFCFLEEPIRRLLSLRLYRCPYERQMKPWERRLNQWGLLGYLAKDVIGADQEENFGIRQNHRMTFRSWDELLKKHFAERHYEIAPADCGWGEHFVRVIAKKMSRSGSEYLPAWLLGGALAAMSRKEGWSPSEFPSVERLDSYLRCPDCQSTLHGEPEAALRCRACGYQARDEAGVYNLLPSSDRQELYPGDRTDTADFSRPSHEQHLLEGWYSLEGVYGGKFRWIGERATLWLQSLRRGSQVIRIRGYAPEQHFEQRRTLTVAVWVNGEPLKSWPIGRPGLFVLESAVPDAEKYLVELRVSPTFQALPDVRQIGVNIGMVRLLPRDAGDRC